MFEGCPKPAKGFEAPGGLGDLVDDVPVDSIGEVADHFGPGVVGDVPGWSTTAQVECCLFDAGGPAGSDVGLDADGVELVDVSFDEVDFADDGLAGSALFGHGDECGAERAGIAAMSTGCGGPYECYLVW